MDVVRLTSLAAARSRSAITGISAWSSMNDIAPELDDRRKALMVREFAHRARCGDDDGPVRLQAVNYARSARGEAFGKQEQERADLIEQRVEFGFIRYVAGNDDPIREVIFSDLDQNCCS